MSYLEAGALPASENKEPRTASCPWARSRSAQSKASSREPQQWQREAANAARHPGEELLPGDRPPGNAVWLAEHRFPRREPSTGRDIPWDWELC